MASRLDNPTSEFEREATLEEACILVYVAGELVADDDDAGETPTIPLALHAAVSVLLNAIYIVRLCVTHASPSRLPQS